MRIGRWYAVAVGAVVCWGTAASAPAQTQVLTLSQVLARARDQAPQVVSARLALEENRGRLAGASLRFQNNPDIDTRIGNRTSTSGRFTDVQVSVGETFEPGGRRAARMTGAQAEIDQGTATVEDTERLVQREAAVAYYRVLHAKARIELLDRLLALATRVHDLAERRFRAGDIAILDVNLARAARARVGSDREAADAARVRATGDLKQLLRLAGDVDVEGTLATPPDADFDAMVAGGSRRPELRALANAVRSAEADVELGDTFKKPNYRLGVQYSREEGDQVLLGALTVTLPLFANGQELRATGLARAIRLRAELENARIRIHSEVETAFAAYQRRLAAVRVLEVEAMPGLEENDALATRSFDVGQLGLTDLLVIRRELVDTRVAYLDALLEAAVARVDLDASAAVLR